MGAGAVRGQQGSRPDSDTFRNPVSTDMSCEACEVTFSIFKRKKTCVDCRKHHCSACLIKEPHRPSSQRRCRKCRMLSSGNFCRFDLMQLKVKDLRHFLVRRNIPTSTCTEKNDLIELILRYSGNQSSDEAHRLHVEELREKRLREEQNDRRNSLQNERRNSQQSDRRNSHASVSSLPSEAQSDSPTPDTPSSTEGTQRDPQQPSSTPSAIPDPHVTEPVLGDTERLRRRQQAEMRETEERLYQELHEEEPKDPRPANKRTTLDVVNEEEDIEVLSVKQLKEILATNFVDFKGCCEKYELIERVKRLWEDHRKHKGEETGTDSKQGEDIDEEEACKVCMDHRIDCVLLECGHMIVCTKCGRRLAECPICRQYVSRVVRIFKA